MTVMARVPNAFRTDADLEALFEITDRLWIALAFDHAEAPALMARLKAFTELSGSRPYRAPHNLGHPEALPAHARRILIGGACRTAGCKRQWTGWVGREYCDACISERSRVRAVAHGLGVVAVNLAAVSEERS